MRREIRDIIEMMRKYVKKQIQKQLDEMPGVHRHIMNAFLAGSADNARTLLAACQEAAIAVGNTIEETEKGTVPGDAVVARIETYCELVYELWQKAEDICGPRAAADEAGCVIGEPGAHGDSALFGVSGAHGSSAVPGKSGTHGDSVPFGVSGARERSVLSAQRGKQARPTQPNRRMEEAHSRLQQLDRSVLEIKEHIQTDIPERLEIAFLPYKASMWDCLESVWEAAAADPDCETYVVPIPYLDKGPDDTFTDIHCEADKFPPDVPVISWQEYDIAARHPDIIYIHNPYDNVNNVTSVHPSFYAKELKKHTDMLVYIPYFVCMNDQIEDHFCVLPGTIFADRVIVQSETVRQAYIEAYHKFEKENHIEGHVGNAEEKFVALGSPKYDRVLKTTRENVEIPDDWRRKMINSDGSFKKVILYNTTVTQILEHREKVLEKIRSVFDLLWERDDVVLLWRPHPLSLTTCGSVSAQLSEEYRALTEEYRAQDWGIYDDTADLHRAIALSDAYYGDMSSVVELYRMTGKPIMIEDVELV